MHVEDTVQRTPAAQNPALKPNGWSCSLHQRDSRRFGCDCPSQRFSNFFVDGALWILINTRGTVMKPKFANFKFYQKIVFKSCSLFKMHKNVRVYSQNTEKRLMWAVSLFLSAHFIKPRCNVWYCNTHVGFNVNLIAVVRLDHWYRRKIGFTQVWRCKRNKNTESFTAYKRKFRSSINPEWNEWIRVVYTFQSEVRRKIDK